MDTLIMDDIVIEEVKNDAVMRIKTLMKRDLVKMILYGSYARGDYNADSDVDIAIITKCNRMEGKKYSNELSHISTDLAMNYFAVVNFVMLPQEEFVSNKSCYEYFKNIYTEGQVLYG